MLSKSLKKLKIGILSRLYCIDLCDDDVTAADVTPGYFQNKDKGSL